MSDLLPWNKIDEYLLSCGEIHDYKAFCKKILDKMDSLVPFDQGRLYFLDDNNTVYDEYLVNVDKRIISEYYEYYSKVDNGSYDIGKRIRAFSKKPRRLGECIHDWNKYDKQKRFFKEYIKPNNLRQSLGFGLKDEYHMIKSVFILDRNSTASYSQNDIEIVNCISRHLDNFHQHFFLKKIDKSWHSIEQESPLTGREVEVADLLKQGVTPKNISAKLCICETTVKKHISNMHQKLNVSTRQELIVKLLNF